MRGADGTVRSKKQGAHVRFAHRDAGNGEETGDRKTGDREW
jgi:hypothetical protein